MPVFVYTYVTFYQSHCLRSLDYRDDKLGTLSGGLRMDHAMEVRYRIPINCKISLLFIFLLNGQTFGGCSECLQLSSVRRYECLATPSLKVMSFKSIKNSSILYFYRESRRELKFLLWDEQKKHPLYSKCLSKKFRTWMTVAVLLKQSVEFP